MGFAKAVDGFYTATPTTGWQDGYRTGPPASNVTMIIFISNLTGSDATSSTEGSKANPYKTTTKALTRTGGNGRRDGSPDWILLATNETWVGQPSPQYFGPGLNEQNRMIFSTYDKSATISAPNNPPIPNPTTGPIARPILQHVPGQTGGPSMYFSRSNTAVLGIDFYCASRDTTVNPANANNPGAGVGLFLQQTNTANVHWEDNRVRWFENGMTIDADQSNTGTIGPISVRRNVIHNNWGDKYGIGSDAVTPGFLVEENLVDHNGWDEIGQPAGSSLNHNLYLSGTNGLVAGTAIQLSDLYQHGNIMLNDLYPSNNRCGGRLSNNLWQLGGRSGTNYGPNNPNIANLVENEVYVGGFLGGPGHNEPASDALNMQAQFDDGGGHYGNAVPGIQHVNIKNCIVTQGFQNGNAQGISVVGLDGAWANLVTFTNCISYKFSGTTVYVAVEPVIDGGGNRATNSPSQAAAWGWTKPERTPETYMAEVIHDGSTWADFSRRCRQQSRRNWNPLLMAESVNDYIRQGFNKTMIGSAYAGGGTIATGTITVRDAAGTTASVPVTLNISS